MQYLLLKLILIPLLTALTAFTQRRWSHQIGGAVAGLPLVVGPILIFLAIEQDMSFVHDFAASAMAGYANITAFLITFLLLAGRFSWQICLSCSMLASFVAIGAVASMDMNPVFAALIGWLFLGINILFVSRLKYESEPQITRLKHPVIIQGITALLVVLAITGIAEIVGPHYSALFAALPNMWIVLFSFTYANGGKSAIFAFARGAIISNIGYLSFLTVMVFVRNIAPIPLFLIAFATALVMSCVSSFLTGHYRNISLKIPKI